MRATSYTAGGMAIVLTLTRVVVLGQLYSFHLSGIYAYPSSGAFRANRRDSLRCLLGIGQKAKMFGGVSGFKTSGGWLLGWQRHKALTAKLSPWLRL